MMRALKTDELEWAVIIQEGNETEVEWYETRPEAEGAAQTAIESHCTRVYVARCVLIEET